MATLAEISQNFLSRSQQRIIEIGRNIAFSIENECEFEGDLRLSWELIIFNKALSNKFNNWTENETLTRIAYFTKRAKLNEIPVLTLQKYKTPIIIVGGGGSPSSVGVDQVTFDAEINALKNKDIVHDNEIQTLSDAIAAIDLSNVIPQSIYNRLSALEVNTHTHPNKFLIDEITQEHIDEKDLSKSHRQNNNIHVTQNQKDGWDEKVDTNDQRLSDARTPTAHNHPISEVAGLGDELQNIRNSIPGAGETGATPNLQIGTVTEGIAPDVSIDSSSTPENPIINFVLKSGEDGENFAPNVIGASSGRLNTTYQGNIGDPPFSYLEDDTGLLFFRIFENFATDSSGWTTGIPFASQGWVPLLAVKEVSNSRSVIEFIDWIQGTGTKPDRPVPEGAPQDTPLYIGFSGYTEFTDQAVNIKGSSADATFESIGGVARDNVDLAGELDASRDDAINTIRNGVESAYDDLFKIKTYLDQINIGSVNGLQNALSAKLNVTSFTSAAVKALLESLIGVNRLDASAIKNLQAGDIAGLAQVATTGDYNDLVNKLTGAVIKTLLFAEPDTVNFTPALRAKLESMDARHYLGPVQNLTELAAITGAVDKARVFVEDEGVDYFLDIQKTTAEAGSVPNADGPGFWGRVNTTGETPTSIQQKYESLPDRNPFRNDNLAKLNSLQLTPTTTKGDLQVSDGTKLVRLALGSTDESLVVDPSDPFGIAYRKLIGTFNTLTIGGPTVNIIAQNLTILGRTIALTSTASDITSVSFTQGEKLKFAFLTFAPSRPINIEFGTGHIFDESNNEQTNFFIEKSERVSVFGRHDGTNWLWTIMSRSGALIKYTSEKTGNYTVLNSDLGKVIPLNGAFTVTLPNGLPPGFWVDFENTGTGDIIFSATTLQSAGNKLPGQWTAAQSRHVGGGVWRLFGEITT